MRDEPHARYGAYRDKGGSWYLAADRGETFVDRIDGPKYMVVADYANIGVDVATRGDWRGRLVRRLLDLNERFPRGDTYIRTDTK